MKVAFSTTGTGLDSQLESRFGRAPKFLIYDLESNTFDVIDNLQNLNAAQGAGIQSAQNVARMGVQTVVTGHCGPKAFRVLKAAGVKVMNSNALTVGQALEMLKAGEIPEATMADVEGHWV